MPLKLIDPRAGKTPFYSVRGTHLGVYVDKSTKLTDRRKAQALLVRWRDDIERDEFVRPGEPTFLSSAVAYMEAGGERTYMEPLIGYFGETALRLIDQAAIDEAALKLYPNATPATRNREVYTPVSAVLKRAGMDHAVARPNGSQGRSQTIWLWPERAFALVNAATARNEEFGLFLKTLLYTGMRLSEGLNLVGEDVRLKEAFAYVRETKNDDPRPVFLPDVVVSALKKHPRGIEPKRKVFRWYKSGRLYSLLDDALTAAGIELPKGTAFHVLRHTWATWMRRYGGVDTAGLVATKAWKDRKSAARYEHTVISEDAAKAKKLPVEKSWKTPKRPRKRRKAKVR